MPKHRQDTVQSNLIAMVAKLIIYRARNKGMKPSLSYFLNILKIEIGKERCIAIKNNRDRFFHKMGPPRPYLRRGERELTRALMGGGPKAPPVVFRL